MKQLNFSAGGAVDVSVVVPAYNEMASLPVFWERVSSVLESTGYSFEIIVVDDGSTDESLSVLRHLSREDPRVRYISLSRNFGHQAAQVAGIEHSVGDAVITMDADLQHPPAALPEMLDLWKRGYYVVNTCKKRCGDYSRGRSLVDRLFYSVLRRSSGLQVEGSDFRLLDRRVVELLQHFPEQEKILRGLVAWIGFPQATISYVMAGRVAGTAKYTLRKRISLAVSALLSFSQLPLRVLSVLGSLAVVASLIVLALLAVGYAPALVGGQPTEAPSVVLILGLIGLFGGAQLAALGLLGEYVGHLYTEAKKRPAYLVKESSQPPAPVAVQIAHALRSR